MNRDAFACPKWHAATEQDFFLLWLRSRHMNSVIIPQDTSLYQFLEPLAEHKRMLFLAGLPGVGKSLLLNQLASIAQRHRRRVHLLQWDVCRQPFETDRAVKEAYPEINGVTHGMIRKAVGIWARKTIGKWAMDYAGSEHLLIGELSMVGNRLIELARKEDDRSEALLSSDGTHFITPVPTREVRRMIEGTREKRSADPQHQREQADAVPEVMRALWEELYRVAHTFGVIDRVPQRNSIAYDPDVYGGVFSALLEHRNHEVLSIDVHLSTDGLSVYDLDIDQHELVPTAQDVADCIAEVGCRYPTQAVLDQEMARWYVV